ncbi:MAG: hypothetical protein ABR542_11050, partial [Desulfonatronovibrio sp.]
EAKWSDRVNLNALRHELECKSEQAPFTKDRKVVKALFVKQVREEIMVDKGCHVLTPGMVIDCTG